MLYMPSGFWPRLISRMMSNSSILDLIRDLLGSSLDDDSEELCAHRDVRGVDGVGDRSFMTVAGHSKLNWSYWKTGIELWIEGKSVLRVSEIVGQDFYSDCAWAPQEPLEDNNNNKYKTESRKLPEAQSIATLQHKSGIGPIDPWIDTNNLLFAFSGAYTSVSGLRRRGLEILIPDLICLNTVRDSRQEGSWTSAKLLAIVVDFIDALLEDWFPGLGARDLLPDEKLPKVVRLVPCPLCIGMGSSSPGEFKSRFQNSAIKKRPNSSKRFPKKEDRVNTSVTMPQVQLHTYAFLVEDLVYASKKSPLIECSNHKGIPIADIAPDLMFADIQYMVLDSGCVDRNKYIDSGSFGDIFYGYLYHNPSGNEATTGDPGEEVAIKVQANSEARGENRFDERHVSMEGYINMRAELSILESLNHPHIIKVCIRTSGGMFGCDIIDSVPLTLELTG